MVESISLSVVIPAYNESTRIGRSLEQILSYLSQQVLPSEVIVVDDGSTDDTVGVVEWFIHHQPVESVRLQLLSNPKNMGKGYSVKNGVLHASGSIVAFTDADLSAPITELPKLVEPIRQGGYDVVIGSRAIDPSLIGQHQSPWRELAGRVFNWLIRAVIGLKFKDTQCGFKAYRCDKVLPIFQRQTLHGFGFDVEVLYLAKKQGLRIEEVPVVWNHVEGSRVHMVKDSLKMLVELLKIRWYWLTGKYD